MGALYLKDLADKTRRGLEGRVREGRSGGGLCYGYRVVRGAPARDGEPERGLREIDPMQVSVIRRIFEEFAGGQSPITIARRLNEEGSRALAAAFGPRARSAAMLVSAQGSCATASISASSSGTAVAGSRIRPRGVGSRAKQRGGGGRRAVPELRIIEQELWDRVQARLATVARPECSPALGTKGRDGPRWQDRRPRHVLTAKITCGACNASYVAIGRDYLACQTAERRGPCTNRVRVRRSRLEAQVLEALGTQLMDPKTVADFVAEFTAE